MQFAGAAGEHVLSLKLMNALAKPLPGAARVRIYVMGSVTPGESARSVGNASTSAFGSPGVGPMFVVQSPSVQGWIPHAFFPAQRGSPWIVIRLGFCVLSRVNPATPAVAPPAMIDTATAVKRMIRPAPQSGPAALAAAASPAAAPSPAPMPAPVRTFLRPASLSPPMLLALHSSLIALPSRDRDGHAARRRAALANADVEHLGRPRTVRRVDDQHHVAVLLAGIEGERGRLDVRRPGHVARREHLVRVRVFAGLVVEHVRIDRDRHVVAVPWPAFGHARDGRAAVAAAGRLVDERVED